MKRRGAYVLFLRLDADEAIEVGRLGRVRFEHGAYAYVGSAMGGLDARIARHLRSEKKLHWHIDYLLERATVTQVMAFETAQRIECDLSQGFEGLEGSTMPVRRCRCDGSGRRIAGAGHTCTTSGAFRTFMTLRGRMSTAVLRSDPPAGEPGAGGDASPDL